MYSQPCMTSIDTAKLLAFLLQLSPWSSHLTDMSCTPQIFRSCWNFVANKILCLDIRQIFRSIPLLSIALLHYWSSQPLILESFLHKSTVKSTKTASILTQLEKAQLGTYCDKIIGQVKGVFTTR